MTEKQQEIIEFIRNYPPHYPPTVREIGDLQCKIDCLRTRMHVTALEKGISHPDVLSISQRLDKIINELYKIVPNLKGGMG